MIRLHFTPPISDPDWDAWKAAGDAEVAGMLADLAATHSINADLYKRPRDWLLAATNGKCAYCELPLAAGQRKGDVEHYRPKGAVRGLDGKVVKVLRDGVKVKHPGYFWLAYHHENLLPSCSACNRRARDAASGTQTGKSDIFPTLDGRWAACPEDVAAEKPALLNPWLACDDPAEHLMFDRHTGLVIGITDRGEITVQVLGLNRDQLPEERLKACSYVSMMFERRVSDTLRESNSGQAIQFQQSVENGSASLAAMCRVELEYRRQQLRSLLGPPAQPNS